jgi:DNA invertase Pin-like site-specific DNA recombinase
VRAALYLRVSTCDQNTYTQYQELWAAARAGWSIAEVFEDAGISGSKCRDQRPAFDRLHRAIARREVDIVMAWSVDRRGRSLQDLVAFLAELRAAGIDLYLHQRGIDTTTPAGRALFHMLASSRNSRGRSLSNECAPASPAPAHRASTSDGRGSTMRPIRAALAKGLGIRRVAREYGVGVSTVQRIRAAKELSLVC